MGGNYLLGAEGARAIAEVLRENTTVTTINFGNNHIDAEGVRAIAEALRENTTVTTINLGDNKIGTEGVRAMELMLDRNKLLHQLHLPLRRARIEYLRMANGTPCFPPELGGIIADSYIPFNSDESLRNLRLIMDKDNLIQLARFCHFSKEEQFLITRLRKIQKILECN